MSQEDHNARAQTAGHAPLSARTDDGRYRLLVDAITDYAVFMLDANGVVSSWNPGARRFKGYQADEIIGRHFSCFYTPEDRAIGLPQSALDTAATQGRFENEGWRLRKDGTRFWAHVMIDPIRAPDGTIIGYAKVTRDLTERRLAEETLRRSEEQFRLLVQGVTDYAIYMLSPEGIVSSWNQGAQRIKGYAPEEIVGQHFSRFYSEEDRASGLPQRGLATAIREGRFESEGWRVRKDGTRFWASVVIDAIRDPSGRLTGFAKVTRDITEKRAQQQALDQAREQLAQSQKMEAVGQLTGGVAHDFNNLLMAVIGSLELVKKRLGQNPQVIPLIDNAMQGAQRGAVLTQRMLAFARRQPLQITAVDIPRLVAAMSELVRSSLGPTFEILTDFDGQLPPALTDPNQLETALLNLLINARDAMAQGGRITISAREETVDAARPGLQPGRYVRLAVTDQGEGMDEETLARAAEPFFTTKGVGRGTGLGLSMVHGIAQQSGGRLVLESRKGEGATAELWLPVATEPLPARQEADDPLPLADVPARPITILVVDDDDLVLANTVAMLEDLGHSVIEARSGTEALDILHRQTVDLLVTDQVMPRMTGIALIETIRDRWPGLPVILASGYVGPSAGQRADLVMLPKPFAQADIARAIERARVPA